MLSKQYKEAESLLLERVSSILLFHFQYYYFLPLLKGDVEQAIGMYQELQHWEDALSVAEAQVSTTSQP